MSIPTFFSHPSSKIHWNPKWQQEDLTESANEIRHDIDELLSELEREFADLRAGACANIEIGESGDLLLAKADGIKSAIKKLKKLVKQ